MWWISYLAAPSLAFVWFATVAIPAEEEASFSSRFRGLQGWTSEFDCKEKTYSTTETTDGGEVRFCVDFGNQAQKRCEVALFGPDLRETTYRLSYEMLVEPSWPKQKDWVIVGQVHGRLDPERDPRCPLMSIEVLGRTLRLVSRYDQFRFKDFSKPTCSGDIQSNIIADNVELSDDAWTKIDLKMRLSLNDGDLAASIDGREVGHAKGPNTYNDVMPPFLKFGVYRDLPRPSVGLHCIRFRNFRLEPITEPLQK
jgi:hypothetical protein